MSELTITCCEFCNKWFNVDDKRCSVFDFANTEMMSFCPECGEKLIQCINKMKKEIYGHKEENK